MERIGALVLIAMAACGGDEEVGGGHVTRGAPDVEGWLDLTITGDGFHVVEGMPVELQVGIPERPPERLGWAETVITGGGFALHLPGVLEPALYKRKVLWIDGDGDAACDDTDLVFADYSLALDDLAIELDRYRQTGMFAFAGCDDVVVDWPAD